MRSNVRVRGVVLKPGDHVKVRAAGQWRKALFLRKDNNFLQVAVLSNCGRPLERVNVFDHRVRLPGETDADVSLEAFEGIEERFHRKKGDNRHGQEESERG